MTKIIGSKIYHFPCLSSTQDKAKEVAETELEGCVVISDRQTAGRGSKGRCWLSPSGGVYLSVILKPDIHLREISKITLLSAVSLSETVEKMAFVRTSLKWPNDILINNKKVGGILCESAICGEVFHFIVVGIGVNLNNKIEDISPSLLYPATSILEEARKKISRKKFIEEVLFDFDKNYLHFKKNGFAEIREKWKRKSSTLNKNITILDGNKKIKGKAMDISEEGFLILENKKGEIRKITTGDVVIAKVQKHIGKSFPSP